MLPLLDSRMQGRKDSRFTPAAAILAALALVSCIDVPSELARRQDVRTGAVGFPHGSGQVNERAGSDWAGEGDRLTPPDVFPAGGGSPGPDLTEITDESAGVDQLAVADGPFATDGLDASDICQPQCEGLECGPDGCGGSCGVCPPHKPVCFLGKCKKCKPDCMLKECGPDGCGGSCGSCPSVFSCVKGKCLAPECTGKDLIFEEEFHHCTQGEFDIIDEQPEDQVTWWVLPDGGEEGSCQLYLGDPVTGSYMTGSRVHIKLLSPEIDIPTGAFVLTFRLRLETEPVPTPKYPYDYDVLFLTFEQTDAGSFAIWSSKEILNTTEGETVTMAFDVSKFSGSSGRFVLDFDTFDSIANDYTGIFVDGFRVESICPYCKDADDCDDSDECTENDCLFFANEPEIGICIHTPVACDL